MRARSKRRISCVVVSAALVLANGGGSGLRAHQADFGASGIEVTYACGNRFLVASDRNQPVTVTYRVPGTSEEGFAQLDAAPEEDPGFSEALIETQSAGKVELYVNERRVASAANGQMPCPPPMATQRAAAAAAAPTAQVGAWGAPFAWPVVALHLHLLPNGQVLSWGRVGEPQLWNAATGGFTAKPMPDELFCAGHAFLQDGRLLVAGGHISDDHGLPDINLFSTASGWDDDPPMRHGRWYPSVTIMGNNQAVILAGADQSGTHVALPEVWASGAVRELTNAGRVLPYYPRAFLAPNGRLFYAGEEQTTRYLDIAGAGTWTTVGNRRVADRNYGSAVMFQPGRILYAGGGLTTNTAEVINLFDAAPAWTFTGSMAFARRHHNLTMLPTGEVLATAGVGGSTFNDLSRAVLAAEIWNPGTGTWRTVASAAVPRGYHGTAILLPDGRVLQSGAGDAAGAVDQKNAELYSPPYLFAGARPTITSAPGTVGYGTTFRVTTPNAAAIAKVSLIRLGSVTHAFDQNQRYRALSFTRDATGLTVTMPAQRNRTPPGHYMLFILNGAGVPSIAKIVQVR
jgi:hypothetical protein